MMSKGNRNSSPGETYREERPRGICKCLTGRGELHLEVVSFLAPKVFKQKLNDCPSGCSRGDSNPGAGHLGGLRPLPAGEPWPPLSVWGSHFIQ